MKNVKELLSELYPTTRKVEGKSFLSRCYCEIKDYWGLVPILGGIFFRGLVGQTAATFYSGQEIYNGLQLLVSGSSIDPVEALYSIPRGISQASNYGNKLATEIEGYTFFVGQFLTWVAKNKVKGAINGLRKFWSDKNER